MYVVFAFCVVFFFFKQKTAYEMRISDWSSDVCSSDLQAGGQLVGHARGSGPTEQLIEHRHRVAGRATAGPHHEGQCGRLDRDALLLAQLTEIEIGRASCRERVCQYV